jgi:hypothetical protein
MKTRRQCFWIVTAALALGCGKDATAPPPPPPVDPGATNVTIVSATPTTVRLRNSGGPGAYQLEVWGRAITGPSGCFTEDLIEGRCPAFARKLGAYDPVAVLAGYDESLSIVVTSAEVYGYKVYSRPVNTAVWTQTGCTRAVSGAWLTFNCP